MKRARLARLVGVAALGAVGLATSGTLTRPVDAAALDASAWWRMSATAVDLGATGTGPVVGQVQVSSDPAGVSAIGAVRFALDAGEVPLRLVLPIASTSGTPSLVACPAGAAWNRVYGGARETAPTAACQVAQATATVAEGRLSVPLTAAFARGDVLDVVLVPASATGVPPTFTLVLEAVADGALEVSRSVAAPAEATDAPQPAPPSAAPPGEPAPSGPSTLVDPAPAPDLDSTPIGADTFAPAPAPAPTPAPELAAAPIVLTPALPAQQIGVRRGSPLDRSQRAASGRDGAQRLGFVLFPAVVLCGIVALNAKDEAPRALGPLLARRAAAAGGADPDAGPELLEGGIGRFRRVRSEAVPRV